MKCFRIPDDKYQLAKRYAELQGSTISIVVRQLLDDYIAAAPAGIRDHSCQHKSYRLTCAEYDTMAMKANGRCQRCGQPTENLLIDHDHRFGFTAVRGLVCASCNTLMGKVDSGKVETLDSKTAAYLTNSWHLAKAMAKGLSK
jgi:Recombination endonuclease VII.